MPKFDADDMWCREAAVRAINALKDANLVNEADWDEAVALAQTQIADQLLRKRPGAEQNSN